MIELVYPPEPAPAVSRNSRDGAVEMLPVVEPNGLVVGQASRCACHKNPLLHPVVHLHIMDRMGRLYIQKRSDTKDLYPGRWDTAVGGHVSYGESFLEALHREAWEELGLFNFNPLHIRTYVHESETERELVNVYAAIGHFNIRPDNDEVSDGRWWTEEEIMSSLGKSTFTPNFEEEYVAVKNILFSLL